LLVCAANVTLPKPAVRAASSTFDHGLMGSHGVGIDDHDRIVAARTAGLRRLLQIIDQPGGIMRGDRHIVDGVTPLGIHRDIDFKRLLQGFSTSAVGKVICSAVNLL